MTRCRRAIEALGLVYLVAVLVALSLYDRARGGTGAVGPTGVAGTGPRRS